MMSLLQAMDKNTPPLKETMSMEDSSDDDL